MTFLYLLIGLVLLVFILGQIAPKNIEVSRSIIIQRPQPEVFDYLKYLKNQDHWAKWNRLDPEMDKSYVGTDGTLGFESHWNSNHKQVGQGSQTILGISENRIDTQLNFIKPFKSEAQAFLIANEVNPDSTEVIWGFTSTAKPPANIMYLFFNIDKNVGADFEQGLLQLKSNLES